MLKRSLVAVLVAALALVAMIGVEIVVALRRDYLPTEPPLEIGGTFGDQGAPELRFVVLGDSTAAGLGAGRAELAYPTLLARRLAENNRNVELHGFGVSGARVKDVLEEQVERAIGVEPDLVFIGIGANDVTHLTALDEIEDDAARIVRRLAATGAVVVVAGAPDMRAAAWLEPLRSIAGWRGRAVAAAVEEGARSQGATIVPLADRTGPFFASDPDEAYAADDFHPGPGGYRAWADAIYPELEAALASG